MTKTLDDIYNLLALIISKDAYYKDKMSLEMKEEIYTEERKQKSFEAIEVVKE